MKHVLLTPSGRIRQVLESGRGTVRVRLAQAPGNMEDLTRTHRPSLSDGADLAHRKGWVVVDRYADNDVSAHRGKTCQEYRRLLSVVAAGQLDAVIVWHLDRLHRQPKELEEFFDVVDAAA